MRMPDEPLSPAQKEIMEIVWEKGEVAAIEVRQLLADGRELARETVRTVLRGWRKRDGSSIAWWEGRSSIRRSFRGTSRPAKRWLS